MQDIEECQLIDVGLPKFRLNGIVREDENLKRGQSTSSEVPIAK